MTNPKEDKKPKTEKPEKPDRGNMNDDFQSGPKGGKGGPKFNFYWIYLILALVILFVIIWPHNSGKPAQWNDIKPRVERGEVDHFIYLRDQDKMEVYLKEQFAKDLNKGEKEGP